MAPFSPTFYSFTSFLFLHPKFFFPTFDRLNPSFSAKIFQENDLLKQRVSGMNEEIISLSEKNLEDRKKATETEASLRSQILQVPCSLITSFLLLFSPSKCPASKCFQLEKVKDENLRKIKRLEELLNEKNDDVEKMKKVREFKGNLRMRNTKESDLTFLFSHPRN